ncbi:MAG: conjugal transfer protein MobC [Daejeonella sp.]
MQTGENIQGLRKIIDFTRLLSLLVLAIHVYISCYGAFKQWQLRVGIVDHLLDIIIKTGIADGNLKPKFIALGLLAVSLIGAKGRKDEKISMKTAMTYIGIGLVIYFITGFFLQLQISLITVAILYMGLTGAGYLLILTGGTLLSRLLSIRLQGDIFNRENETFPQEERLLENEYSINLPAQYNLKGKIRRSWINIINPFRALLVIGTPGSGKSYFVIRHVIDQHIRKGFTMFVYDFKFDDLTIIAYNTLLRYRSNYKRLPKFYIINFDDLSRSHRCNPLDPHSMTDITDATESARTIMLGLNMEWIKKQGDFFVESPINFVTAIIWFLKKYEDGKFCTLPHVIELMQVDYDDLFPVLRTEKEIEALINPFISAYVNKAREQLEGQVASAKIGMARLSSPQLYWVLSGNDFTLDINNPDEPKIVCMGNNLQKIQVYGAVLSLYVTRLVKLVNRKGMQKSSLIFDEFPTIYLNNIDSLVATARSNKVATTLGVQDFSQLKKDYGKDQAEVIMNIVGNIVSGQVVGDTAKQLSERFGKIIQERNSISINSADTSVSKSTQLDYAVPASRIASLSSGEFVGMIADDPDNKIELKVFHSQIQNDHQKINREINDFKPLPEIIKVTQEEIQVNYNQIKSDVVELIAFEVQKLQSNISKANENYDIQDGGNSLSL